MIIAFLFLIGLCIGSFLNVLIDRLSNGESIRGRSHCDRCKKTLMWKDLTPLVSFVFLRGRCRYCKEKLSWQYPIVELLTGLLFVFVYYASINRFIDVDNIKLYQQIAFLILNLVIFSGLIVIFFADLKYRIIPDEIVVVNTLAAIFLNFLVLKNDFWPYILSALVLFLIFIVLMLLTRGRGMGMGDVKYVIFMGLFLGFPASLIAFYASFLTGAVVSIILIFIGRKKFGQTIPFGPFLILGTFVSIYWGNELWTYFLKILGV